MEEKYCQSCGLPMGATDEMYGIESDGSKSSDYCKYCYENGQFTTNSTMDEMIETCVPHMASLISIFYNTVVEEKFFPQTTLTI